MASVYVRVFRHTKTCNDDVVNAMTYDREVSVGGQRHYCWQCDILH